MTPSHRIEIVIEVPLAPRIIEILKDLDAPGYTLIPRARGSGDRGIRRGDELAGDSSNCVFLIICERKEMVHSITEAIRPILSRSGGICVVSECQSLIH